MSDSDFSDQPPTTGSLADVNEPVSELEALVTELIKLLQAERALRFNYMQLLGAKP